jgi:hypothetical protein
MQRTIDAKQPKKMGYSTAIMLARTLITIFLVINAVIDFKLEL